MNVTQYIRTHRERDVSESSDVTIELGLDTSDPTVLRDLFKAYGVNFTVRSQCDPATLFDALGDGFRAILAPASAFHYVCGPADQRCIVQVLDLGAESMVAAVCTGEGEISTASMMWLNEHVI
jgi:3-oxoacyl-(acyl-carrier-protein) synthase